MTFDPPSNVGLDHYTPFLTLFVISGTLATFMGASGDYAASIETELEI